jgi:hypothetical protein
VYVWVYLCVRPSCVNKMVVSKATPAGLLTGFISRNPCVGVCMKVYVQVYICVRPSCANKMVVSKATPAGLLTGFMSRNPCVGVCM